MDAKDRVCVVSLNSLEAIETNILAPTCYAALLVRTNGKTFRLFLNFFTSLEILSGSILDVGIGRVMDIKSSHLSGISCIQLS
jgi:hypothetical protein